MRAGYGHWAIVALILFIMSMLGIAWIKNYDLVSLDSNLLGSKFRVGCSERLSGTIKLKKPVEDAKLLTSLEYSVDGQEGERSALIEGDSYRLSIRGRPTADATWTLHAYYFNKGGQLSETAQQFTNLACDQDIESDLEL